MSFVRLTTAQYAKPSPESVAATVNPIHTFHAQKSGLGTPEVWFGPTGVRPGVARWSGPSCHFLMPPSTNFGARTGMGSNGMVGRNDGATPRADKGIDSSSRSTQAGDYGEGWSHISGYTCNNICAPSRQMELVRWGIRPPF